MCLVGNKRADIARVIPCMNNFCIKYAHHLYFCGLQKLNTLNLRHSHPPLNPRNHFSTVLIKTNWYTISCKYKWCEGITSLVIPNSVKSIGQRAFYQCYNLTRVYIPISVETIREGAFESCVKLMDPDHPENAIYCEAKEEPEGWILFYGYDFHGLGSKLPLNVHWGTTAGVKFLASTDVEVYGAEQSIAVWNATGEICVLNLAGQIVCQRKAIAPHTVIPVRAGTYVVSVNGVAKKVIVR